MWSAFHRGEYSRNKLKEEMLHSFVLCLKSGTAPVYMLCSTKFYLCQRIIFLFVCSPILAAVGYRRCAVSVFISYASSTIIYFLYVIRHSAFRVNKYNLKGGWWQKGIWPPSQVFMQNTMDGLKGEIYEMSTPFWFSAICVAWRYWFLEYFREENKRQCNLLSLEDIEAFLPCCFGIFSA